MQMKTVRSQMGAHPSWVALALSFILILAVWSFLCFSGASEIAASKLVLVIAFEAIGGWIVWRRSSGRTGILEILGMSLALGAAMAAISGVLVRIFFDASWGWILPSSLAILYCLTTRLRRGWSGMEDAGTALDKPVMIALFVAAVAGGASLLGNIRNYPLVWREVGMVITQTCPSSRLSRPHWQILAL